MSYWRHQHRHCHHHQHYHRPYHRTQNRHYYYCIPKIPPSVIQNWNLKCLSHFITFITRAVNVHVSCHLPLAHLCFDKKEGETFQQDIPSLSPMPFPKTQNKNPVIICRVFTWRQSGHTTSFPGSSLYFLEVEKGPWEQGWRPCWCPLWRPRAAIRIFGVFSSFSFYIIFHFTYLVYFICFISFHSFYFILFCFQKQFIIEVKWNQRKKCV